MPGIAQEMEVILGVFSVLEVLKHPFKLDVALYHHAWLTDRLQELRLSDYFRSVVLSKVVDFEKPDTCVMEFSFRELEVRTDASLYAGDHPLDVLCAKSAGMDCARLFGDWDGLPEMIPCQVDYLVNQITALLCIVE